jgi:TatD DNase family protein
MRLVDAHVHLEELADVEEALKEAKEAGVVAVVAVGSDLRSNLQVLKLSERYRGQVFPALGLHPWSLTDDFSKDLEFIEQNLERCVALGEVGIDYWIKRDKELQLEAFKEVLRLSKKHQKPLILHTRGAWDEALELVKAAGIERAIFHWYSGSLEILRELLARGYMISATPAAEYSEPHRQALLEAPLKQLVLETDAPVNYRGLESRPVHLLKTLNAVAELKGISTSRVAEVTTANVSKFFGIEIPLA